MDYSIENTEMPAFELLRPVQQLHGFVFNSPHSGRCYPTSFLNASDLDMIAIRKSEDFLVEQLFDGVVENGVPLLKANYARAFLDVNREPYELDQKMFSGKLPAFANTRSLRVAGGLGTVARIVSEQREIYHSKLDVDEVLGRINNIYKPYHDALRELLRETHMKFGFAILIDCHSMPSARDHNKHDRRGDFIIGDRFGSSAASEIVDQATQILRDMGYQVAVNKPYAGGFITQHYGRPDGGLHALQIEINRGLYMNEETLQPSDNFENLRDDLLEFSRQLVRIGGTDFEGQFSLAAE